MSPTVFGRNRMKEFKRSYPLFSLCGLNCGLCPRYQTEGTSKCPGCGGKDFQLKHPNCAVITCNRKHDNVDFCFQCSIYPCERYRKPCMVDSFIPYKNVLRDLIHAKNDIEKYQSEIDKKVSILEFLIKNYNDGRRKMFYCIAVNLLPLKELMNLKNQICNEVDVQEMVLKDKIRIIEDKISKLAGKHNVDLKLRK
jgi:hypothetical protein